jgi:hypothetical protein
VPPWGSVRARRRSGPGNRDPRTYDEILDQFAVETNPRYRKDRAGRNETYCNIFVWDVTRAMRAELPHWIDATGRSVRPGGGIEMTANALCDWLGTHGARCGWRQTDSATAQAYADRGAPTVAAWCNPEGAGHIAMVRPRRGGEDPEPRVAQAGEPNARAMPAADAFATAWAAGALTYFVHE